MSSPSSSPPDYDAYKHAIRMVEEEKANVAEKENKLIERIKEFLILFGPGTRWKKIEVTPELKVCIQNILRTIYSAGLALEFNYAKSMKDGDDMIRAMVAGFVAVPSPAGLLEIPPDYLRDRMKRIGRSLEEVIEREHHLKNAMEFRQEQELMRKSDDPEQV